MKPLIFHLIQYIHHLPGQIGRLRPGIMLSIPAHVRSILWIGGVSGIITGHGRAGKLDIGTQHIPHHARGLFDQPKLFSYTQIKGKGGQGFGLVAVQQLSLGTAYKIKASSFQVMVGIKFFFTLTRSRSSLSKVLA